jgi:flagellar motility protein MotE (MotC chaperone)
MDWGGAGLWRTALPEDRVRHCGWTGLQATKSRRQPASGGGAKRSDSRAAGTLPPPVKTIPQHHPILEMLRKQFQVEPPADKTVTSQSSQGTSGEKTTAQAAPHTVTSSSTYPGDALTIAASVCAVVEASTSAGACEKTPPRGQSSSSSAGKRDRTESRSPGGARKRIHRSGAHGLNAELRESEAKWQNRAARAEEDLKSLQRRYHTLEKESKNSRTKWESERTQLIAEKTAAEADADRYKTAAEAADEDCVHAYQAKKEA